MDKEHPEEAEKGPSTMPPKEIMQGIERTVQEVRSALEGCTTPAQRLQKLSERREKGELSPFDFDLNWVYRLVEGGFPLTRKHLNHQTGVQAVVLTADDLDVLGDVTYVSADGRTLTIAVGSIPPGGVWILYPEDLGDGKKPDNGE